MQDWDERRAYTLELRHDVGAAVVVSRAGAVRERGADPRERRWVRLVLVRRRGLLPAYNVIEWRAEPVPETSAAPGRARGAHPSRPPVRTVGDPRTLSWRWLVQGEAELLLARRLEVLDGLGYAVLDLFEDGRQEWDWLRELVRRQIGNALLGEDPDDARAEASVPRPDGRPDGRATADAAPTAERTDAADPSAWSSNAASTVHDRQDTQTTGPNASDPAPSADPRNAEPFASRPADRLHRGGPFLREDSGRGAALRDALARLGLDRRRIARGVAELLDIDPERVETPEARTVARADPEALGALLPALVVHDDPSVRRIAETWLCVPATVYELDPALVESWLLEDGPLARIVGERLEREGLALLGADALRRLARRAPRADVREVARRWSRRLA